ncbi:MAG: hypothetical protein HYS80_01365, partial [Candidatus Aenigmarchaeota archaeon]|nr:hypothetical protein [Candidatus Aenigmarchaeota archaeon]
MAIGVETSNVNLYGKGDLSLYLPKQLLLTADNKRAEHMISQLFRHGRIDGSVRVKRGVRDVWGYSGSSIGYAVGEALQEREHTYGHGFSIVTFDGGVGIAAIKYTDSSPSADIYIHARDEEWRDGPTRFLKNFSREGNFDLVFIAFPANFGDEKYWDSRDMVADHHVVEAGFKALPDALDKTKRFTSEPIVIDTQKQATLHERKTGETRFKIRLKVYGGNGRYTSPGSYTDSRSIREFDKCLRMMSEASSFNLEILEEEDDHVGEETHHA